MPVVLLSAAHPDPRRRLSLVYTWRPAACLSGSRVSCPKRLGTSPARLEEGLSGHHAWSLLATLDPAASTLD